MFEKLKSAFATAVKSLGERELKEQDVDSAISDLEFALMDADVAVEAVELIKSRLQESMIGSNVEKKHMIEHIRKGLVTTVSEMFDNAGTCELVANIEKKRDKFQEPYLVLFLGINGTGKTTTLSKMAHMLKEQKISVVIAAADTFRAGAIEQIREHTNRLGVKLVAQNYGSDPAAVARDAVLYAKSHKVDCVLIDTAGRMQTSQNLMAQIEKITNVVKPDFKIFVGDSLAGNDTINQAREFYKYTNFDASILTKTDADSRGGAALSIIAATSTPIMYIGTGQEYEDLEPFNKNVFVKSVFGDTLTQTLKEKKPVLENLDTKSESIPNSKIQTKTQISETIQSTMESKLKSDADQKKQTDGHDPFEGITDDDIKTYSDLYDETPPENDTDAAYMAEKIRDWIKKGKPDIHKTKKHSMFGWRKK
ncbi:MAG: signal recognition particle-docking protein [Cenarchaeum symbiont of Oopsacas minuta]|nr:signal recognition particle-docking protein [Cenarchaeum symbiont of Oopsacas minuta]